MATAIGVYGAVFYIKIDRETTQSARLLSFFLLTRQLVEFLLSAALFCERLAVTLLVSLTRVFSAGKVYIFLYHACHYSLIDPLSGHM